MAKKKEQLTYGQLPLPSGRKGTKMTKRSWSGLNYRQTVDTGALSMEHNISTIEAPYLTPSPKPVSALYSDSYEHPIGLFAFEDKLIVIYRSGNSLYLDIATERGDIQYTGTIKDGTATEEDDEIVRSVVQFNVYDTPTDPATGRFVKKLLIFPDRVSMNLNFQTVISREDVPDVPEKGITYCVKSNNDVQYIVGDGTEEYTVYDDYFPTFDMTVVVKEYSNDVLEVDEGGAEIYPPPDTANHNYYYLNTSDSQELIDKGRRNEVYRWTKYDTDDGKEVEGWRVCVPPNVPALQYVTVHLSRVFGVDSDRVYASGYNDYTNWNLDTPGEYNESNSWCSPAQANTKAGGDFTGITTFQNHVVCFKKDFMHEVYNTKNPFRLQDIYAEGSIDNRTIQDVDGRLIFVSDDNVKIYTGSNPRIISYYLNIEKYKKAVSGSDARNYYLYCEDETNKRHLLIYDTLVEQWSERSITSPVINFARTQNRVFALCEDGNVYRIDTNVFNDQEWMFETDLITNQTVDIKHIRKVQMMAYIEPGANLNVYVLYDDEEFNNNSHLVYSSNGREGQVAIRVKPRQTANYGFKFHVEGEGYVRLYELETILESGGDMYV